MAKNLDTKELNLMISVIKKYYELGMTQEQIAREEFISKSSVCRIIKKAQENNYVSYQIDYPAEAVRALEEELCAMFGLDKAFVLPTFTEDVEVNLRDILKTVADDLIKMLKPEDILSVSWGSTMDRFTNVLERVNNPGKTCDSVVLLNGSLAGDIISITSGGNVERIARYFNAKGYILPAPLLLDSEENAALLMQDSHIQYIMDMVNSARMALISIGGVSPQTVLMQRNAYTKAEYERFMQAGAVGDIAGRYYDIHGKEVDPSASRRTLGLGLHAFREKPVRMGIGLGSHKVRALVGALRGGYISMLYTDEQTAHAVLDLLHE